MKLKVVLIDLELTRNQKWLAAAALAVGLMAGVPSFVSANVANTFASGQTLTAAALNENFSELDDRVIALEGAPEAFPGTIQGVSPRSPRNHRAEPRSLRKYPAELGRSLRHQASLRTCRASSGSLGREPR